MKVLKISKSPEIIPPLEDSIRIFNYNIDVDNDLHQNVWDNWKKVFFEVIVHQIVHHKKKKAPRFYSKCLIISVTSAGFKPATF